MHTTTAPIRTSSRLLALVLSTLLAASLVVAQQRSANADIAFPNTERIEGSDAISIGVAASQRIFPDDAANVAVLARSDNFPDALAATSVASTYGGPLMFTPTSRLDTAVRNELARVLEAGDTVFLMGGENALSPAVEEALLAEGYETERINGTTRIETAARATDFVMAELSRQGRSQQTAVLVRSHGNNNDDLIRGWVDSVACGGLAANNDYPILLTNPGEATLHTSTRNRLDIYDFTKVLICGGPSAVPIEHQTEVSTLNSGTTSTVRASGRDRIETAVDVASRNGFWGHNDPTGEVFILVPGWDQNFAYGLAAAQLSDALNAPLLLVSASEPRACEGTDRSRATLCYLERVGDGSVAGLVAVGSTSVISDATFSAAAASAGLEEDVTPPAVPTAVSAVNKPQDDGTNVDVSWSAVDDGEVPPKYTVYFKATDSAAPLTKANGTKANPTPQTETSLTVDGLTKGTSYDFAVTSVDEFGNESALSSIVSATPTDEAPGTPANAPSLRQVPTGVELTWQQAPEVDAAGYRIQRAAPGTISDCETQSIPGGPTYADLKDANGDPVVVTPASTVTYVDTSVEAGNDYCYRYAVIDTTGNSSGTSPAAGPITVEATPPPPAPPAGAPSIQAVNFDNQPGTVDNPAGPSVISVTEATEASFRVDVVVPAGAYTAGQAGTVRLFKDASTTAVATRSFTAPEDAAVKAFTRSVTVVGWGGTPGAVAAMTAKLVSASGDAGPASTAWSIRSGRGEATGPNQAPRPVLRIVSGVDTDPRTKPDQAPVASGSPGEGAKVDVTPHVVIENIPRDDFYVQVYVNGVQRYSKCILATTVADLNRVEINAPGAAAGTNDATKLDGSDLFDGENKLTASLLDVNVNCGAPGAAGTPVEQTRSGDSNTVSYFLSRTNTGIIETIPAEGDIDPYGEKVSVEFNNAVTDVTITLRRTFPENQDVDTITDPAPAGNKVERTYTTENALVRTPGTYAMTITYKVNGSPRTETVNFTMGITQAFFLSAARGCPDGSCTSYGNEAIITSPAIHWNGAGPSGFYETGYAQPGTTSCDDDVLATDTLTATDQVPQPAVPNFEAGQPLIRSAAEGSTVQMGRTICYRYTALVDASGNPTTQGRVSRWQPDGTIPVAPANSDFAVQASSYPNFGVVKVANSWPQETINGQPRDLAVYYAPSNEANDPRDDNTGWQYHRAPLLVHAAGTGATTAIPNGNVAPGWFVRYYTANIHGNESLPGREGASAVPDGQFRQASSVTPLNGLNSTAGQLSGGIQHDSVVIDVNGAALNMASPPATGHGVTLLGNDVALGITFGTLPSGSTASVLGSQLTIAFGSGTTLGGQSTPRAVAAPTALHGGLSQRGLTWLTDSTTGHAILLPSDQTPVRNVGNTW